MLTLMKKDLRVNAVAIVGSAILQVAIYIVMIIWALVGDYYYALSRSELRDGVMMAAIASLAVMALMAAVYGGSAFALERRERSGDFLGVLPIRRWRIIGSKIVTATICLAIVWLINAGVMFYLGRGGSLIVLGNQTNTIKRVIFIMTTVALMAFGVGWLCSTFVKSASVAASISIAVTLWLVIAAQVFAHYTHRDFTDYTRPVPIIHTPDEISVALIPQLALWTGLTCLIAGTIYYFRRVEP